MNWLRRIFAQSVEQRSAAAASTTWDLLRTGVVDSHAGVGEPERSLWVRANHQ
jgi:hypothetical protein